MPNYTYPGTQTVKNKFGITDERVLTRLEGAFVEARQTEIALRYGPKGRFDAAHLKSLHQHLFQDVYEWAGRTRDERVNLSDGTVATQPVLRKPDGKNFLIAGFIPDALDFITKSIRDAGYLRGLSRQEFAERAASIMAELNSIHPFREGNGRTQRTFVMELAREAGHKLDFSVVSKERMIQASIEAHERNDPEMMRRLFNEISDSSRVEALRNAIDFFERHQFSWNDHYLATAEAGHEVELTMAGIAGDHFMGRTKSKILIGNTSDLPEPRPPNGGTFTIIASSARHTQ